MRKSVIGIAVVIAGALGLAYSGLVRMPGGRAPDAAGNVVRLPLKSDEAETAAEQGKLEFSDPRPVADAAFQDLDGQPARLADYAGKVVIVNLWATWCAPCIREMPSLIRLAAALPRDKFEVLAISLDRAGPQAVRDFWQKLGPSGLQPHIDPSAKLGMALKAQGMPTTLVLDARGMEIARVSGALDWGSKETIDRLSALRP